MRVAWPALSASLLLSACSGSSGTAADAANPPVLHAASAVADLTGDVLDAVTMLPIEGATVTPAGQPPLTTDVVGRFAGTVPSGRVAVTVSAPGYLEWTGEVALGTEPMPASIPLMPATAPVDVGPAAATIDGGGAVLSLPEGAYAAATPVAVTWLGAAQVGAAGVAPLVAEASVAHQVLGVLDVVAGAQPALPVELRVEVPAGLGQSSLALLTYDATGAIIATTPAVSVAGGVATFTLAHFSRYGVAKVTLPADAPVAVVTALSGDVSCRLPSGLERLLTPGDAIPTGSTLTTSPTGSATAALIDGSVLQAGPSTSAKLTTPATLLPYYEVHAGKLRVKYKPMPDRVRKIHGTCKTDGMGVRGTVVTVSTRDCIGGGTVDTYEVTEGLADLTVNGEITSLPAGTVADVSCGMPAGATCRSCGPEVAGNWEVSIPAPASETKYLTYNLALQVSHDVAANGGVVPYARGYVERLYPDGPPAYWMIGEMTFDPKTCIASVTETKDCPTTYRVDLSGGANLTCDWPQTCVGGGTGLACTGVRTPVK